MTLELSRQAEALLAEMARDHGVPAIKPDEEGLIPIILDDSIVVLLTFNRANDTCFIFHVLGVGIEEPFDAAWSCFDTPAAWDSRRTRIGFEQENNSLSLVCELFLKGISYGDFSAALERFVEDIAEARRLLGLGKATLDSEEATSLLSSDNVVIRV
ncbi:MAG: type III secretion system chaperone [Pseudomonadota bacterium]